MTHRSLFWTSLVLGLVCSGASIARADEVIEEYNAYIGEDDLYNSSGDRLTQPWQIIRQDRANYHRFRIRQAGDEADSFFGSEVNRARAEAMVQDGAIERRAAQRLLRGDCMIHVRIYGRNGVGRSLDVEVR